MTVNKYVGDYMLVEDVDEKGRFKTTAEYIGDDYYYLLQGPARHKAVIAVCAAVVFEWAFWIAALVPFSTEMQHMYVSLPFAFSAVPLFMMTGVVWQIARTPEPLEHRHADRISNRLPATCAINGMLLAFALVAGLATLIPNGILQIGDAVFLAATACALLMSLFVFSKKSAFALRSEARKARLE